MRIAVIGWGSLIWCPGCLNIKSRWYTNGPKLPIEFSRVSKDGRLTLVITPKVDPVQTLWAVSTFEDVGQAAENLRKREGTSKAYIGQLAIGKPSNRDTGSEAVSAWLREQNIEAAVWTTLPPKAPPNSDTPMNAQRAVDHINGLDNDKRQRAEEYVRNTPEQIETKIRKRLREEFDWDNNPLSLDLLED